MGMKGRSKLALALSGALVLLLAGVVIVAIGATPRSPTEAVERFERRSLQGVSELEVTDPLIVAGDSVLPLVVERVRDKSMPRRRYAIGHLGKSQYKPALPLLSQIVLDDSEKDLCRGDALMSLAAISPTDAEALRGRFVHRKDYLGDVARHDWKLGPKRPLFSAMLATVFP
jgi:hypothetical protein